MSIHVKYGAGNTLTANCSIHNIAMYQKWVPLGVGVTAVPMWVCPTCEALKASQAQAEAPSGRTN